VRGAMRPLVRGAPLVLVRGRSSAGENRAQGVNVRCPERCSGPENFGIAAWIAPQNPGPIGRSDSKDWT
jgi:hypothetical protein